MTKHRKPSSLLPGRAVSILAALGCLLPAGTVEANELDVCVESSEAAQALRDDGRYLSARKNLIRCAHDVCPAVVRRDCLSELERLDAVMPTVVFSVSGVPSERLPDVKIWVENHDGIYGITGKPVKVDPGSHSIRFELGEDKVVVSVIFKAGEINRTIEGAFAKSEPEERTDSSLTEPKDLPSDSGSNWLGYSLVGAGTIALGGMTFLWLRGRGDLKDLREGCGATQSCDEGDVTRARNTILLGDVLGGVGMVAIGVGVYHLATGSAPAQDAMRLDASVGPREAGFALSGAF